MALLFVHILFQRPQQIICGVIQDFCFGLDPMFGRNFHTPRIRQLAGKFNLLLKALLLCWIIARRIGYTKAATQQF